MKIKICICSMIKNIYVIVKNLIFDNIIYNVYFVISLGVL